MSRLSTYMLIILIIGIACQPESGKIHSSQIKSSVEDLLDRYQRHVSSGSLDSVMTVYSSDPAFHWVEDGGRAYNSVKEIENAYKGLFRGYFNTELELSNTVITPLPPDHAHITTQFKQELTDSSGNGFSFSGAMTITAAKEQGGWKFLVGHTSSSNQQ